MVSHNYATGNAKIFDPNIGLLFWRDQPGDNHLSHLHTSFLSGVGVENSTAPFFTTTGSGTTDPGGGSMPDAQATVAALSTKYGAWEATAAGGILTQRGSFYQCYLSLPPTLRQGVRRCVDLTPRVDNPDAPGYTQWFDDGAKYTFPIIH